MRTVDGRWSMVGTREYGRSMVDGVGMHTNATDGWGWRAVAGRPHTDRFGAMAFTAGCPAGVGRCGVAARGLVMLGAALIVKPRTGWAELSQTLSADTSHVGHFSADGEREGQQHDQ